MPKLPFIISVIPARGGSKRIPGKNIRPLAGKPLINWSIEQSLESKLIQRHILSTDDTLIAMEGEKSGAEILMRHPSLATDETPSLEVFRNVILSMNPQPDILVVLQPTSPFREKGKIDAAIEYFIAEKADSLISVSKSKLAPNWLMKIEKGFLQIPEINKNEIRTQDQASFFVPNGALYIYKKETILSATHYAFGEKGLPWILESPWDMDIDIESDFKIAEAIANGFDLNS